MKFFRIDFKQRKILLKLYLVYYEFIKPLVIWWFVFLGGGGFIGICLFFIKISHIICKSNCIKNNTKLYYTVNYFTTTYIMQYKVVSNVTIPWKCNILHNTISNYDTISYNMIQYHIIRNKSMILWYISYILFNMSSYEMLRYHIL